MHFILFLKAFRISPRTHRAPNFSKRRSRIIWGKRREGAALVFRAAEEGGWFFPFTNSLHGQHSRLEKDGGSRLLCKVKSDEERENMEKIAITRS